MHRHRACFLLLGLLALGSRAVADEPRPNVVLFLVDDMGWMDCGRRSAATPQLSGLVRWGVA